MRRRVKKNENIFEVFPEKLLRNLVNKSETIRQEIEEWEKECRDIKDSCKIFNDSLMTKIIDDERIINSILYDEINKIKYSIDLIGEDLKQKFNEEQKWDDVIQNEQDILLFFDSAKKKHARASAEIIWAQIKICLNKLKQLFQKLFEHTGGYKCLIDENLNRFDNTLELSWLVKGIFRKNEKLSEVVNKVSCTSSEYRGCLKFCLSVKLYKDHCYPRDSCYIQPTVKYKQSSLRSQLKEIVLPERPSSIFVLKRGHLKQEINLLDKDFDINIVRNVIDKKEQERAVIESVEARADAYLNKTRSRAEKIKKGLQSQMRILNYCPYCEKFLDDDFPHADHIYPVSKGGLSTSRNMVYICSTCNKRKTNKTLREFIKENNLNRERIERNLELLKKTF